MTTSNHSDGNSKKRFPQERFDTNKANVTGRVTKIWSRDDGTIYARIELPPGNSGRPQRATVAFPNGAVSGEPISLMAGELIRVSGYASDITYVETLGNAAERIHFEGQPIHGSLFDGDKLPELAVHKNLFVHRSMMGIIPESLEYAPKSADNQITVDGVINRITEHAGDNDAVDLIIRLAVFDRHTETTGTFGPKGERRKPHYMSIKFAGGRVDNRQVHVQKNGSGDGLKMGDRIRITGKLGEMVHYSDLHRWMVEARAASIIATLPSADKLSQYYVMVAAGMITAERIIQFTAGHQLSG